MTQKTVLITGASSGMGYAAAKLFAAKGWQVFAGARRVNKIPVANGITPMVLDVTDSASMAAFVQTALQQTGQIDVLINNAGYGEYGPFEEVSMEMARKQIDTNLMGAAELAQLVLPGMRKRGEGRIVNISSIGSEIYTPWGGWYYATKHAMNVWSDTLDSEVRQFGIRSIIVEPGGTQSSWSDIALENAKKNLKPNSPYKKLLETTTSLLGRTGTSAGPTSDDLAQDFYRAATDARPKLHYFHNLTDRVMVHFVRNHPTLFHGVLNMAMNHYNRK